MSRYLSVMFRARSDYSASRKKAQDAPDFLYAARSRVACAAFIEDSRRWPLIRQRYDFPIDIQAISNR
jgi:hypothetical protein